MGHTSQAYQYRRSSDAETICNVLVALIGDVGSKSADMGNRCVCNCWEATLVRVTSTVRSHLSVERGRWKVTREGEGKMVRPEGKG